MSKKVTLTINGNRFDIDLEDGFAGYMDNELDKEFNIHGNNDIKTLLQVYVKKNYEVYQTKQMLKETLKKI